ncbi:hypothetical protein [Entomospira culicis]|uniref:Uncharacterized protein n=1 Tax=Entomospira culicis TaxID=2719989 RepID=A0A968KU56_9SPIO|nr:hypothetical protein [Entomospira culicis]NIZ18595.1 hypothetical protein [Entomospira culicis]NIZ68810.1 hypothetical protein [Entomospira culicis]WDI37406.1 hypothetical protein PVA46_01055 [Entomospira culicis]WDI39034.1 hypothetical protein PVA47_01060 [Entomospira culicis]
MHPHQLIKITLTLNHALQEEAIATLTKLKSPYVLTQSARSATIPPKKFWQTRIQTKDEQQDIFELYVPYELELLYLQTLVDDLYLLVPGRGSVLSQAVTLYTHIYQHAEMETSSLKRQVIEQLLSTEMHLISLIGARGDAGQLCHALLTRGYPSPSIAYGMGMGTRSRMGLLRITISPEKELLHLPVHHRDSQFVLQLLAHQARLDLPGKGFLSYFPIRYAKINTKTHNDDPSRLASIEQVISAIDTLQGGIEWRSKNMHYTQSTTSINSNKMVQLTFTGTRGISEIITPIAFDLGGRGATMTRKNFYEFGEHPENLFETHERESCSLALMPEIAVKLIMHVAEHLNWQDIGLSSIEEYEIFHAS